MENKKLNPEEYKKKLDLLGRNNLIMPQCNDDTIESWVAALIKDVLTSPLEEDKPKDEKKKLDAALAKTSKNPYERARAEVLSKMNEWSKKKIEELEKTGKTDDRFYRDFAHNVTALGDKYSEKSLDKPPQSTDNPSNN